MLPASASLALRARTLKSSLARLPATPTQDFDYEPWPQISAAAKDFVRRLLEKQPEARMMVDEALEHPWIT